MKTFKQIYTQSENKIAGIAAAPGIVIGKVHIFTKENIEINDGIVDDVDEALQNLDEAIKKSKKELDKVFSIAKEKMEVDRAAIFEAQVMILDDPFLITTIRNRVIKEKKQPEYIVNDEISKYLSMMRSSSAFYMKERANDIDDIKNRIIRNLQKKRWQSKILEDVIVVSDILTPADAILFSRRNVQGFITDHGGLTSHAAIISRSLNIPAIVGTHNASTVLKEGEEIIVDGFHGYIIYKPNIEQVRFFSGKIERLHALQKELEGLKDVPAKTTDDKEIGLYANVDVSGEIDVVITNDAKGIGLYRTEQIMEEAGEFPTEEEQTKIYSNLASRMYPKSITIRAFDIGGDKVKFVDFKEPNPFLGMRGIRVLLENKGLFKSQIRAIYKSSKWKNIHFMLPMITTIHEIKKAKEILSECRKELREEGVEFDKHLRIGIMIEVPSAAVMAYEFAQEVDFVSIGTNDLIQFLMAVDRGNDFVSELYQEFAPAVIRTIHHIIVETKRAGKFVNICGEMAADTLAIPLLIGLGMETLSMSPTTIPYAKRIIRTCSYQKMKELAEECLTLSNETDILSRLEKFFKENQITRTRNII